MFLHASGSSVSCGSTLTWQPFHWHACDLGLTSAISLIFNQMIGTGSASISLLASSPDVDLRMDRIFATPSVILRSAGSVGVALTMWLIGAIIATAGSAVYLEYGTVSVINCMNADIYQSGVTDATPERRREELSRIHLQASQVYGNLRLCRVRVVYREPSSASSPQVSHRRLAMRIR